ncbi:unnamed protein product [Adineta ricciae]|uniref:Uncharacterized protein n=1 Tax=Adineta ricciae TaxID=249248 RepID=A0A815GX11_ADIRI|nr:unnamed protein product [Adineta ricciae]CAF1465473.1 unnamed protein product [Adineta ricciae]
MEVDSNLVQDCKQEEDVERKGRKSSEQDRNRISKVSIIIAIIPILQIFMGWRYSQACPINKLIPHYSIVAGIVALLLVILISITQLITRVFGKTVFDDNVDRRNPNRATMFVGCGICSIMCINLSLFIFLLGWSVTGLVWVIDAWYRVQYIHAERNDYCHPILYQFTFAILLITTLLKVLFFCIFCKNTCVKMAMTKRRDTITSEDG